MIQKRVYSPNYKKNLDLSYNVIEKKIDYMRNGLNFTNTKINFLLALMGVIVAFYIPLFISNFVLYQFISWQFWIQALSLILPVFSLFCLLSVSWPKNYDDPTDTKWLCLDSTLDSDHYEMKHSMVLGMKDVYETSNESHKSSIFWLKWSIRFIFVTILLVLINILLWKTKVLV